MKACINHTAINVIDFDWYRDFFEHVCAMHSYREDGAAPARKIWFTEGIQLNEVSSELPVRAALDHIGFHSDDVFALVAEAIENGCSPVPGKPHWFALPNGVQIEVKNYN